MTRDPQWVPYGINFVDERHGWVGGSTGGFENTNGGLTWVPADMGLSVNKIRLVKRADGSTSVFAIGKNLHRIDIKE